MQNNAKIFSGTGSQYLAQAIANKFGEPLGKVNIQRFSDGEIGVEFPADVGRAGRADAGGRHDGKGAQPR